MNEIQTIAAQLEQIEQKRVASELKPVQAGDQRQAALILGVNAVAASMGVQLKPIYAITSLGELEIASIDGKPFGSAFADALNTYCKPRCGILPTAVMDSTHSNWCRINHFDAERMVLAVAQLS